MTNSKIGKDRNKPEPRIGESRQKTGNAGKGKPSLNDGTVTKIVKNSGILSGYSVLISPSLNDWAYQ